MEPMPEPDEINPKMDLKAFRLEIGLNGVKLAAYLNVHKAMVSQVENDKKEMPIAWVEKLKKLTDPTFAARWQ
jgi:transcriptional regulator with XRE-family HTH domain